NSDTGLTRFNTHYYLALSYLASNTGIANAIVNLKSAISNNPDSFLQTKAEWYLALAYLKTTETKKAEQLLKKIILNDNAGEYRQKALLLLTDLKKNRER
ncbi:MAG: tetratricopeptide repeat protein, partial [Chitinophagaceae bacterium]|nr:tetratricopeptide repeat protein [Chitinophagaceae bacterium]